MKITPVIGLEVHVELKTDSKMFCGCNAEHFHAKPNTHTCPVCLGMPGALPVPNKKACQWCVKLGLALGCSVNEYSFFERKNYFYPDLSKSYQITQYQKPFTVNGKITVLGQEIQINRAHMEEDTGKSVHMVIDGEESTLLDFNRSGVPLVEIVSEPDIVSSIQAKEYLLKIQQLIRYLGISNADIEKGSMRCEPTINLKIEDNDKTFYTPLAEIKNVASLTGVQNAIDFEIERQTQAFAETKEVKNSKNKTTRGWDADKARTFLQREKEGSADYRYFPEPDIPPIEFTPAEIEEIRMTLPEMSEQKIEKYQTIYGLSDYDAKLLAEDQNFATAYEALFDTEFVSKDQDTLKAFAKFAANLFLGSIKTYLNETQENIDSSKIVAKYFWDLFNSVQNKELSSSVAKQVTTESYKTGKHPVEIAKEMGLIQVSDSNQIEKIAQEVIAANPKAVQDYQKNPMSIGFLIGQLMRASGGSANPQVANEILEKLLK